MGCNLWMPDLQIEQPLYLSDGDRKQVFD